MASHPSFILFDLDGVLVSSREVWFRVLEEAGRRFRGRAITREEFDPTFGQGTEADQKVFELDCTPAELNQYYIDHFESFTDGLWTNPDARPVLTALRATARTLGVVTNTVSRLANRVLQVAELSDCFTTVACADQVSRPKPAPDIILHALRTLNADPAETWVVGDSKFDREAAEAAKTFFVGLGTDGDLRIEQLRELPSRVLASQDRWGLPAGNRR
jgi:HAD superfamily hydrolase (TIGR01549 family)